MQINSKRIYELTMMGVVAALYVVLTLMLSLFPFGILQFRISEGLNHLAVFNKRYILAISVGVFISNTQSSFGVIDMVFGTLGTFSMLTISYYITRRMKSVVRRLAISTIVDTLMMWCVAVELYFFAGLPFWATYGMVMLSEFFSLVLGAIVMYFINKRIDLVA